MTKYFLSILSLLFTISFFAQTDPVEKRVENLLNQRRITCYDIIQNSYSLIPEYYNTGNLDTVAEIIEYIDKNCRLEEGLLRMKILLAIQNGKLSEATYKNFPIIQYIAGYHYSKGSQRSYRFNYYDNSDFNYSDSHSIMFDSITQDFAVSLKNKANLTALDSFFLNIYSNQDKTIFDELQKPSLVTTQLKSAYDSIVGSLTKRPMVHGSIYTGIWIPFNNASILGPKGLGGIQFGYKKRRMEFCSVLELRFGKSANPYMVEKNDSIYTIKEFTGFYAGFEAGYSIVQHKANEVLINLGIAFDSFEGLNAEQPNTTERLTKKIVSFNINPGIEYRRYFNGHYIGLDVRYNFIDYKNPKGTDLSGNTLTLRLKYGLGSDPYIDDRLKELEYPDWRNH